VQRERERESFACARNGAFTWGKFYTADLAEQVVPVRRRGTVGARAVRALASVFLFRAPRRRFIALGEPAARAPRAEARRSLGALAGIGAVASAGSEQE